MLRTLRGKLIAATTAVYLALLVLLALAGQRMTDHMLEDELRAQERSVRVLLAAAAGPLLAAQDDAALQALAADTARDLQLAYLRISDAAGRLVAQAGRRPPQLAADGFAAAAPGAPLQLAGDLFPIAGSIAHREHAVGRFELGLPAAGALDNARQALMQTLLLGGAGLAASLLAMLLLTAAVTRGLRDLGQASERIGRGELDLRLPEAGDDEVARVSAAFNRMSRELAERIAALQEAEARQRSLVDALNDGVLFQDAGHRVVSCNAAAARMLGLTPAAMQGGTALNAAWRAVRRDGSLLPPDERPSAVALRSGTPQREQLVGIERGDGRRCWLQVNAEPLRRPGEAQPYATVTSLTDVTERIAAEDRLQQLNAELEARVATRTADLVAARDAAERASQAKSEFLSRMSHELRTPLNAILGFAQLLQLEGDRAGTDVRAGIAQIERAGWHLLDLINEVLDLSRIEAGALSVTLEPVAVGPLAAECLRLAEPLAAQHGVTLHLDVAGELAATADRVRLRQVLVNLLSNAVKYNRRDGAVHLSLRPDADDPALVAIAVRDTGPGFTPEQQAQLYQPFNRLGGERYAPGTGIGLVITRRLADLMRGTLELQTAPGAGSTFTLRLPRAGRLQGPAAAGPPPTAADGDGAPPAGRLLLYIEDNPSNVDLLRDVVGLRPGLEMKSAADGASGIALAHCLQPDLVVVDIGLPDVDGFEVCRRLRADPVLGRRPIIALSANAMEADIARGKAAGFDAYLTKPLDVSGFLQMVDRLVPAAL